MLYLAVSCCLIAALFIIFSEGTVQQIAVPILLLIGGLSLIRALISPEKLKRSVK